jgi:serine protease Do
MGSKKSISMRPLTAALALAGTAVLGATAGSAFPDTTQASSPALQAPPSAAVARSGQHASLADMVEAVGPSVVQIDAKGEARAVRTPFGYLRQPGHEAMGSGFIVDESGVVITNNHVIDGATTVRVKLSDGTIRQARVLGRDAKTDLAVLRIEGGGKFKAVQWGDSDKVRVGDNVFAMGSPFGLGNTVTAGIVSARGREIGAGPYDDFLQVDAAINSGNSGGPLFDSSGRVIGVNTAIFSPSGGNVGIGFAIPSQMARNVARQIAANGTVTRGHIGVGLQELSPSIASALGLKSTDGALIAQVSSDGPAAASGLERGDVVRSFNGRPIEDSRDFAREVARARAGTTVPVTIVRDGRELRLNLRIGQETV